MRTLRLFGIFSLAALWGAPGCGEPFTAAEASDASSSSSGGGGGGGDGGGGGAGAATSSSSSAGGGGEGGCAACKAGEFCTASETCVRCADRGAALSFGAPTTIEVEGSKPAFPRVREEPGEGAVTQRLVYVATFGSSDAQIATATGRPWTAGEVVASPVVNSPQSESGPLLLPVDAPSPRADFPKGSLLFDRLLAGPGSLPVLLVADELGAIRAETFDALNMDGGSHSVAVAHGVQPYRYWFMNKHQDGGAITSRLLTTLADGAEVQELHIVLPGDCPAQGDDLAPWVTPDGSLLFFQAPYSARGDCAQASVLRSFYVRLGADGLPVPGEKAKMLLASLKPEIAVMTPSLSPDECTLYVASDLDMVDRRQRLYAASRR
ncbi:MULTISPECIES: hypothetical protein [Sorangium]|uniref:Secreted protein n=1 Tax=Sorangium cellulosum TaxID=56 RepID=A0A4P2QHQ8_SORCE|nr:MULTISPECIES: hypothetical protein [Sorangium]AUX29517.1 hypothetical protein SOCE836_016070 [Sorangium cellulosum]WCQ88913.1 hypothetical protein NQZ70_01595 [Sorangium sp. Soce836]